MSQEILPRDDNAIDTIEEPMSEQSQAMVIAFFIGAVPLVGITQLLGLGMPGLVGGAIGAGMLAVAGPSLAKRIPAINGVDWRTVGARLLGVEDSIEPATYPDERIVDAASPAGQGKPPTPSPKERLHLGATLHPHGDEVLSKRIGMFGIPGAGKSNGLTVFVEELGKLEGIGAPFVLADTEGEYDALCSKKYLMRPFYAHADNVTPENAFDFGQQVFQEGLQVVLNLQSYEDDNIAAMVMIGIIRGLRAWSEARKGIDDRTSCMFILDEAAIWFPQNQGESMLSKEKDDQGKTLLNYLHAAFFGTVVRRGRKRGIGFLFAGQRIAEVDKRCIQCDWLVLFQQTAENDIERYASLGVPKEIPAALSKGEAYVIHGGLGEVHQFRRRTSPDNSKTPGAASLRRYADQWAAASKLRAMRSDVEPTQDPIVTRNDTRPSDYQSTLIIDDQGANIARNANTLRPDEKPTQPAQNDAIKYRLTDDQVKLFCALYPNGNPNKDECLRLVGANTAYRAHANEIIEQYKLSEKKRG